MASNRGYGDQNVNNYRRAANYNRKQSKQEVYNYAINLRVDPVNLGFESRNNRWHQKFQGLGAFNHYFAMLIPKNDGYTLPDVWDGFYQMTLAKFSTLLSPDQLQSQLYSFHPSLDKVQLHRAVFRSSKLVCHSGNQRLEDRKGTDFIALRVNRPDDFDFEPLLDDIQQQISVEFWTQTSSDDLHINLRLYPTSPVAADQATWTWKRIEQYGVLDKVARLPIDFRCSTLEIIPARRQCTQRDEQSASYKWLSGVTEIDGRCSGCQIQLEGKWSGACLNCGEYERINPVWSITHASTSSDG